MDSLRFYKTFEKDSLAAGDSWTKTWTAEEDMRIKRIHIVEKSGRTLRKSTFYLKVAAAVYTRELIPCSVVGPDVLVTPVLDIPFAKAAELSYTLKNNEGVAIDLFTTFETE